jgi:hypothetical protein
MRHFALLLALCAPGSAPASAQCVTTLFASNGGTSTGGAVYFDLGAAGPVLVESLESNFLAAAGTPVGLEVWVRAGTSVGFEGSPAGWTLVSTDDGTSLAHGQDVPTPIALDPPFALPAGTTGVALVANGSGHARTNGNGSNQAYTDGFVDLALGATSNVPFAGVVFAPRVWNGTLCYRRVIGSRYCTPAAPSSTGAPAALHVTGTTNVLSNDVRITVVDAPPGALVLALVSSTTGLVAMPGGSQGTLCLGSGGSIGRFVGQAAPASSAGTAEVVVDLTALPTPTGFVQVTAGQTWSFQAWYRDANPGPTSNFTDAVSVSF